MGKEEQRSEITLSRLVATALAAITAAFLGSRLGTAGTVIGAGVASMVSTVAGALYQHSLDRTGNRVRSRVTQTRGAPASPAEPAPIEPSLAETTLPLDRPPADWPLSDRPLSDRPLVEAPRRLRRRTAAALTALAFVIGMAAVTGYELLTHGPLSGGDNGTTISSLFGQPTNRRPPTHPTTTATQPTTTTPPPTTSQPPTTTPTTPTPPTTTTSPTTTTQPPTTTTQPLPDGGAPPQ